MSEEIVLEMKCYYSQRWEDTQRVNLRVVNPSQICDNTKFELEFTDLKYAVDHDGVTERDLIQVGDLFEVRLTRQNPKEVSGGKKE